VTALILSFLMWCGFDLNATSELEPDVPTVDGPLINEPLIGT
jgi:hypothetical protein